MKCDEILEYIVKNGAFEVWGDPFCDEREDSELCDSLRELMQDGKIEISKLCNGDLLFIPSLAYCRQLDKEGR
jgi:hypothetical protein